MVIQFGLLVLISIPPIFFLIKGLSTDKDEVYYPALLAAIAVFIVAQLHLIPPDAVGLVGVCLFLVQWLYLQMGKITINNVNFQLPSIYGSVFIIHSLVFQFNLSAFVMEVFFLASTFFGLYRNIKLKKNQTA